MDSNANEKLEKWLDDLDPDTVEVRNPIALRIIGLAQREIEVAQVLLQETITQAIAQGYSWADVARTLGITRQEARETYEKE